MIGWPSTVATTVFGSTGAVAGAAAAAGAAGGAASWARTAPAAAISPTNASAETPSLNRRGGRRKVIELSLSMVTSTRSIGRLLAPAASSWIGRECGI